MEGVLIENVKGRFIDYIQITALNGFCFYDKDVEPKHYMTRLTAPLADMSEIEQRYIVVKGNADELNTIENRTE